MQSSMIHRGPDGAGWFEDTNVAMAMRRLSIIDLQGGWQPLYNEDRSLVLMVNGEIYNYLELREQLLARGHHFATNSDCETILHLYEDCGEEFVQYIRGMYAIALWDCKKKRLLLVRDRMGEKPLYLFHRDGGLYFASELRGLLLSRIAPFDLDASSVNFYFHYQYIPEPKTPIRDVVKLPAGIILRVDTAPWQVSQDSYWNILDAPAISGDPIERIQEELERVSELVVRSDVPVGVALSGGMDSSAVACLAARKYPGTLQAFSVGYPERPTCDERFAAKELADYLGIPMHEIVLTTSEIVDSFPETVYWRDDPIADISGFGYYAIMRSARERGIFVMLLGQGGDELFWGYPWVTQAVFESRDKSALISGAKQMTLSDFIQLKGPDNRSLEAVLRWGESLAGLRPAYQRYQRMWRSLRSSQDQLVFYDMIPHYEAAAANSSKMYSQAFVGQLKDSPNPSILFSKSGFGEREDLLITQFICQTYLLENGIAQGDRLSMACSVELRLPLLDYRLVETVIGLRKHKSDVELGPKAWLKRALEGIVPDWVLSRPKRGFTPPTRIWQKELFRRYGSWLKNGHLVEKGVITPSAAQDLSEGPYSRNPVASLSFSALVLEVWCRQYRALS